MAWVDAAVPAMGSADTLVMDVDLVIEDVDCSASGVVDPPVADHVATEVMAAADMGVAANPTTMADVAIDACVVIDRRIVRAARQLPLLLHLPVVVLCQTVVEPCPAVL